jgi:hypothetical protein
MDKYFELHVTVLPHGILDFARFCAYWKAKPLYIQLNQGEHPDQLMLATDAHLPDDAAAKEWALSFEKKVGAHFGVARVKLESRLTAGPNEYYEAHWKLDYSRFPEHWAPRMRDFMAGNPGFLASRSLLDTRTHYLSRRIYGSQDHLAASVEFSAAGLAIDAAGLPLTKVHYERCVFDSNASFDAGWASN